MLNVNTAKRKEVQKKKNNRALVFRSTRILGMTFNNSQDSSVYQVS